MPVHSEWQLLPYAPEQLFDLVADIEKYPEFLPWCRAARILKRAEGECEAELVIAFKHMTESYVSHVTLNRPHQIEATLMRGPFHHLVNRWQFTPAPGGGTQVDFFLDFQFRSFILEKLIGSFFGRAVEKMVAAFTTRAQALYGAGA
jgi:coenzyme Q-binding protein COQ10